jgi:hypothetical protein
MIIGVPTFWPTPNCSVPPSITVFPGPLIARLGDGELAVADAAQGSAVSGLKRCRADDRLAGMGLVFCQHQLAVAAYERSHITVVPFA